MKNRLSTLMPLRAKPKLFVQVFLNRAANHLPLYRVVIHVADCLAGLEKCFTARHLQFQNPALGHADFADATVRVDGAACNLLQIIAGVHDHFRDSHHCASLHVELNFGAKWPRLLLVEISLT